MIKDTLKDNNAGKVLITKKSKNITGKKKVTWIGTSISKPLENEKFEKELDVDLKIVRAYCIDNEKDARFSDFFFKEFVPNKIAKYEPDVLILVLKSLNKKVKVTINKLASYDKRV